MKDGELYFKTEAGKREIQDRALKLPAALRSILLMVDGQRDQDHEKDERHEFFSTMCEITLPASRHRSITFSRRS